MAVSTFTVLYSHHLCLVLKHFHHFEVKLPSRWIVTPHSPSQPWHCPSAFCSSGFKNIQYIYKGDPQDPQNLCIKKLCIYSYMFKFQSPSNYSPLDVIYLSRHFSHCLKQFLNSLTLMPVSASAIFCFISSTSAKHFPLRSFLIQGNKKKVIWGEIRWIGRVGHRGHDIFGQTLLNTQHSVGRGARKSPIMKWANTLSLQKKNSLKPNAASHNNAGWYTDTDGLLEHSPSGGSLYYKGPALQKIIPVFRIFPPRKKLFHVCP